MTVHPGREVLLAHVDGELPDSEEGDVTAHTFACTVCRGAVSDLTGGVALLANALRVLDEDEPEAWSRPALADGVGKDPGDSSVASLPVRHEAGRVRPDGSRGGRAFRWAAGIVLVSVAGAAAAIIGQRMQAQPEEPVVPTATSPQVAPTIAALTVTPREGMLHVAVTGAGAGSRLYVTVEAGAIGRVAIEGADSPRFTAVDGRVDIDLRAEPATVRVTLPVTLREAIVTAAGATLVTVRRDSVSPAAASTAGILLHSASRPRME
jgi:hypothetical protein